jgi:glycosyltransferase involved in cell wall biosynthesis
MQLGLPVVTTRAGGNTEAVTDGETGLLVDYDDKTRLKDAILRLWRDGNLARQLADKAKESVGERFGKERMVEELKKLLNSKF